MAAAGPSSPAPGLAYDPAKHHVRHVCVHLPTSTACGSVPLSMPFLSLEAVHAKACVVSDARTSARRDIPSLLRTLVHKWTSVTVKTCGVRRYAWYIGVRRVYANAEVNCCT